MGRRVLIGLMMCALIVGFVPALTEDVSAETNSHIIYFDANGGSTSYSNKVIKDGESFTIPSKPVRKGYTFKYWWLKRLADQKWFVRDKGWYSWNDIQNKGWSPRNYYSGDTHTLGASWRTGHEKSNYRFYAQWRANTFTVRYNANGGSGVMEDSQHTYGVNKTIRANGFKRTGYSFAGWNLYDARQDKWQYTGGHWYKKGSQPSGSTLSVYKDEETIAWTTPEDKGLIIMYAVWRANPTNNGTGASSTNSGTPASTPTAKKSAPVATLDKPSKPATQVKKPVVTYKKPNKVKKSSIKIRISGSTATVTWGKAKYAQKYRIRYKIVGTKSWVELGTYSGTKAVLNGLAPNSKYYVRIKSINGNKSSAFVKSKASKKTGNYNLVYSWKRYRMNSDSVTSTGYDKCSVQTVKKGKTFRVPNDGRWYVLLRSDGKILCNSSKGGVFWGSIRQAQSGSGVKKTFYGGETVKLQSGWLKGQKNAWFKLVATQ